MVKATGPRQKPTTSLKKAKTSVTTLGTPSQHTQGSRKGKRAWRKNVDLQDVEEALEGLRAEERLTGSTIQTKSNEELFAVDTKGDEKVRKSLPRFSSSLLMSAKILGQRSAVAPVSSRASTPSSESKKRKLSHEEKSRLLRTAKRLRRGPLNSYVDPTELGAGSVAMDVSEAVKSSGTFNVWSTSNEAEVPLSGIPTKVVPKAPPTIAIHPKNSINLPAIVVPHQGTSYNPTFTAHQELLSKAHEVEERRLQEAQRNEEWHLKWEQAKKLTAQVQEGVPAGMTVGEAALDEDAGDEQIEGEDSAPKKVPERKTKKQRAKAAKLREEKRALAEKAAKKRFLASISTSRSMRASVDTVRAASLLAQEKRQAALKEKYKDGLAGHKFGKHVVKEGDVDVQLGEDLSESLRALKPEGNLFRDRFLSLQHRGLVEPRALITRKRRMAKIKEYEKHAWKRFE